jgi:hypothetical protein
MESPARIAPTLESGKPITELVVPVVAGSLHDRVVPLAAELASTWHVPIRLVRVTASIATDDADLDDVLHGMKSWYPHLELSARHLYGDNPAAAIADYVAGGMLVVMSTDHIDAWRSDDSVAEDLIERLGVPAILIGPNVTKTELRERGADGEVVVCLDGSAGAEAGVAPGAALAKSIGHALWLVRIVPEPVAGEPVHHPEVPARLQQLADEYNPDVTTRWEVVQDDDPIAGIEGFAARRTVSFLVAATHVHRGEDAAAPSVTGALAATAHHPVMVVSAPDVSELPSG